MTKERLIELERMAYGKGGEAVHHPELLEACGEIRRVSKIVNDMIKKWEELKERG